MSQRLLSEKKKGQEGGRQEAGRETEGRQMENPNPLGSVMLHAMFFFMMSYSNTFERYVFVILLNWQLSPRNWEWFYMSVPEY